MKTTFYGALLLVLLSASSVSAVGYIKIDDVKGESQETKGNVETEWKVEEGESADPEARKGKVEATWKVEEGERSATVELEIEADANDNATNFGILLNGGSDDEDDDGDGRGEENRAEIANIILQGMQEGGTPVESISLNFERISTRVTKQVRVFGLFPATTTATVEIDAEENVKVKFPWWAVFSTGKDSDSLGQQIFTAISNVLKAKHDTVKNSINNVR